MAHVSILKHGIAGSRLSNLPGLKFRIWATPNGNVTRAANGNSYVYDSENHMIQMVKGTTTISMKYDAFGNRVSKTVTTAGVPVTTQYLVEDDVNPTGYPQVLDELTGPIGSAAVSRTYTYGLQRISQDQYISNAWLLSYYQYDGGGSVRQLTNSVGAVTDSYEYDAFGNSFTKQGTTPNNYLYRGEQYDSDLGLYYLRARYYNPATGRFMSRDPQDGQPEDSASLHKYLYADGDPVNLMDPTGRGAAEYQLTFVPGGTAAAVALPELVAGATQFGAAAQVYAGLTYLTAQDVLALIADVVVTKGIAKVLACGTVGLMASEIMTEQKVPYAAKVSVSLALSYTCGIFMPLPGPPPFPWKF